MCIKQPLFKKCEKHKNDLYFLNFSILFVLNKVFEELFFILFQTTQAEKTPILPLFPFYLCWTKFLWIFFNSVPDDAHWKTDLFFLFSILFVLNKVFKELFFYSVPGGGHWKIVAMPPAVESNVSNRRTNSRLRRGKSSRIWTSFSSPCR